MEKQMSVEVDGWDAVGDSEQETEDLRRALAATTTELEEVKLALLEKEMLLGERQQRVEQLEIQNQHLWREYARLEDIAMQLLNPCSR